MNKRNPGLTTASSGRPDGRTLPVIVAALCAVGGCSPSAESERPALELVELVNPAEAGAALPHIATDGQIALLSWVEPTGEAHRLRYATYGGGGWTAAATVAAGADWFVNWADFGAVVPVDSERWIAHWLVRSDDSPYAYDIALASSLDAGRTWREHPRPHRDDTKSEHGFLTAVPAPSGAVLVWLDGRQTSGTGHAHDQHSKAATDSMALATASFDAQWQLTQDTIVDVAVCDCCQTDAAATNDGVLVVYRDRDPATEQRDIALIRYAGRRWSEPVLVHSDGWIIRGCPVNGPAIDAYDERVAVAWFTASGGTPRVRLAFSHDGGSHFSAPIEVDAGAPLGRVDVVALPDGSALVSWLAVPKTGAVLTIARIRADGTIDGRWPIAASSGARSAGFPQMSRLGDTLLVAWTDDGEPSRIRTFAAPLDPAWLGQTASR